MRRLAALILAMLVFVQPSAALTPAQELVLFGGGTTYYANPTSGQIPPWLSYASAGVRYYWDASGNLQTSPNNLIPNSAMQGAAVGVFPTGWAQNSSAAGTVSASVVATGNDSGYTYIDVLFSGTTTGTGFYSVGLSPVIAASTGQSMVYSVATKLVSGSINGSIKANTNISNGSGYITEADIAPFTGASPLTITSVAFTIVAAGVVSVQPFVTFQFTGVVSPNFTLRIAAPQLSQVTPAQTTPSAFMPTSGAAYFGPVVNDYNPSTLAALGLRSEPQRTNIVANNAMVGAVVGSARTISGITSVTRTASSSAVILASTTNVVVGNMVIISGATPSTYNGTWLVTAATTNVSFTVTTATSTTDSAAGYAISAVSPGSLPTGWGQYNGGASGVGYYVSGVTTITGIPTISIVVGGVPSATSSYSFYTLGSAVATSNNTTYTSSLNFSLAGSGSTGIAQVVTWYASGTYQGGYFPALSSPATLITNSGTFVTTGTGTNQIQPGIIVGLSSGVAVATTLTMQLPKLEQNPFSTSPILTYGSAITVPADNWSITGAPLVQVKTGNFCVAIQAMAEGAPASNSHLFAADDGSNNNMAKLYMPSSTIYAGAQVQSSGAGFIALLSNAGGDITTAPRTTVLSVGTRTTTLGYDGTVPSTVATTRPAGISAAVLGQNNINSAVSWYGWLQQIMVRPPCTVARAQRLSTGGANLQVSNDNDLPMFAANDDLPLIVKIASGE